MDKKNAATAKRGGQERKGEAGEKVMRTVRQPDGVKDVKADIASNKLTVTGKVDPAKVKTRVEEKTHNKKVEKPKKDDAKLEKKPGHKKAEDKKPNEKDAAKRGGEEKKADAGKKDAAKRGGEEKKADAGKKDATKRVDAGKEVIQAVTAAYEGPATSIMYLRIRLPGDGCKQKIKKTIRQIKGVEISFDEAKNLVILEGEMDTTKVADYVKKNLKSEVEVLPPI